MQKNCLSILKVIEYSLNAKDPILSQEYAAEIKVVSKGKQNKQRQCIDIWSHESQLDVENNLIKVLADIFMISETKLHQSFRKDQVIAKGYQAPIRFNQNNNVSGVTLWLHK